MPAAADGAIAAYPDITGEIWKPYEASPAPAAAISPPQRRRRRSRRRSAHGSGAVGGSAPAAAQRGPNYITLFVDVDQARVVFATEGKRANYGRAGVDLLRALTNFAN